MNNSAGKKKNRTPTPSGDGKPPPEDVVPLFLATKTQQLFGCVCDEHVTQEAPLKLINKQAALEDMMTRAAISDFHPVKQIIQDYPGTDFLLVYDAEFVYGQNFYMCVTEEAKERLQKAGEAPVDDGAESDAGVEDNTVYTYKPTAAKEWICLGSDLEIETTRVDNNRTLIKYRASRVRREFGAPFKFGDRNAKAEDTGTMITSYVTCNSYEDINFSINRREIDTGVQAVTIKTSSMAQTEWRDPIMASTQSCPRTFTQEQIKEVKALDSYKEFLEASVPKFELALQQNTLVNAFANDWDELGEEDTDFGIKSDNHLKEYQSFTDLEYSKDKTVSFLDWHPEIKGVIGVSCCERLTAYERIEKANILLMKPSLVLIWSFSDPIHPQILLRAPDDVTCFKFCPTDSNIIAGACMNGQLVIWDVSEYREKLDNAKGNVQTKSNVTAMFGEEIPPDIPTIKCSAVSSIESSHTNVITSIDWIPYHYEYNKAGETQENKTRECHQIVTTSTDGYAAIWDIQNQNPVARPKSKAGGVRNVPVNKFAHLESDWKPLQILQFCRTTTISFAPMCFTLSERHGVWDHVTEINMNEPLPPPEIPTKNKKPIPPVALKSIETSFYCGTEDGEFVLGDLRPLKSDDKTKKPTIRSLWYSAVHDGPVNTVHRNPFFNDIILSVGGWTFKIYKKNVLTPLLSSPCHTKLYTNGHWSLTRASVFFMATSEGDIQVWDLLDRTHEPIFCQNVTSAAITRVVPCIVTRKQHLLAVTDNQGTLHILEIPWNLHRPSANEANSVKEYFTREVTRIEFTEKRRKAEDEKEIQIPDEIEKEEKEFHEILKQDYNSYQALERKCLIELGIIVLQDDI